MQTFNVSPINLIRTIVLHRRLIYDLTRRDAIGRYKGSLLGILWSFLTPIFMLSVYTFVFSEVFKARWTTGTGSKTEFAIVLFVGIIIFNFFSECVSRAPTTILSNANFVTKIIFPLEILPIVNLLSALFHAFISLSILLIFELFTMSEIPVTFWQFPIVLLPLIFFLLGLSWFLSATSVFIRDIGQTIGIFITALMFLSPIFFPISSLPEQWQHFAQLNPLSLPIEQGRNVLIWRKSMDLVSWLISLGISTLIAWLGFVWFQKVRRGFADVL